MKKLRLITLIVLLIVLLALSGISILGKQESKEMTESIQLVPSDANLIIEIRDFSELAKTVQNQPNYWIDLTSFPELNKLDSNIKMLDSVKNTDDDFSKLLCSNSIILSIHDIGKNKLGTLYIQALPNGMKTDFLFKKLSEFWDKESQQKIREYEDFKIHNIRTKNRKNFSYTIVGRNLILSENSLLIEDVIRQSQLTNTLTTEKSFQSVYRTAGEKELVNFYINLNRLPNLISPFIRSKLISRHKFLSNYGSWIALDLSLSESIINLNGFAISSDSTLSYMSHLSSQEEQSMSFENILPEGTAMYYCQSISNTKSFQETRKRFLSQVFYAGYFNEKTNKIKNKTNADIAKVMYGLTENEICMAISNINQLDIFQNAFLIVSTKSKSQTQNAIEKYLKTYCQHTSQEFSDIYTLLQPGGDYEYPLYQFPANNWASILYGSFYSPIVTNYCTIIDNYLIFGRDKSSIQQFIKAILLNKTLDKSPGYQDFKQNLAKKCQSTLYLNINKSLPWINSILNPSSHSKIKTNQETLKDFHEFSIQQIVSDEMIYHNIALHYRPFQNEAPHTIWESRLDASVRSKPVIVKNHRTKEKEIFVQDADNTIYLIDKNGIVLWDFPMDEEILGNIQQIDAYKNGKLQYLFNTRSKIYLIDRLGNQVDRFPISLRSPASCGLSVFDYDNTRKYRICIPTEDKKLYMYNTEGNMVTGWEFEESEHPLSIPPQHIRNGNKDFIAFHDKYRIYILNRKGEIRVQPKTNFPASKNNKFWHTFNEDISKAMITTTNNKGTVFHTHLNGNVDTIAFHPFSDNHYFIYKDINADGKSDYIFIDGKRLEVFDQNKEMILEYKFENEITTEPQYYTFSSDRNEIGIVDETSSQIYLIDGNGKLHNGFPLAGTSAFSISYMDKNSEHFNLFVGGKGKFLYNYDVK